MNLSSPFLNPHTFVISTVSGGRVGWFNYAFYEKHLHVVWARFLFYEVAFCFYFQEMATIAVLLLILLELLWLLSCLFQADKCCTSLRRFFYRFFTLVTYPCVFLSSFGMVSRRKTKHTHDVQMQPVMDWWSTLWYICPFFPVSSNCWSFICFLTRHEYKVVKHLSF